MKIHPAFKHHPRGIGFGACLGTAALMTLYALGLAGNSTADYSFLALFGVIGFALSLVAPRAGGVWFAILGAIGTVGAWFFIAIIDQETPGAKPQADALSDLWIQALVALPLIGGALLIMGDRRYRAEAASRWGSRS
jgi:hypothetical protein